MVPEPTSETEAALWLVLIIPDNVTACILQIKISVSEWPSTLCRRQMAGQLKNTELISGLSNVDACRPTLCCLQLCEAVAEESTNVKKKKKELQQLKTKEEKQSLFYQNVFWGEGAFLTYMRPCFSDQKWRNKTTRIHLFSP